MPDTQPKPTTAEVLAAHSPSRWRSFANDAEILRCCGQDFGPHPTRKFRRGDETKAWSQFAQHQADMLAAAGLLVTAEPTVARVHYGDSEVHARSFNEGFETAVAQGLADDPTLATDWLAEHDAQVAAGALRKAAVAYRSGDLTGIFMSRDDYSRTWLRARADRIAAGGDS